MFVPNQILQEDAHQQIAREMNLSETAFIRKLQPTDSFSQSKRTRVCLFVLICFVFHLFLGGGGKGGLREVFMC